MMRQISARAGGISPGYFRLWLAACCVFACGVAGADQKGVFTAAQPATALQTITSAGPLNQIFIGVDTAAQAAHAGDSAYEIFPPATTPADYGSFVVVNDTLYAPDFSGHGGSAAGNIGTYTAFTPVSQTGVTGVGTTASPYSVTTVVDVGSTGLRLTQVDSYVVGQESYRTDVTLTNTVTSSIDVVLYRAMDCFLGGSDQGYGLVSGSSPGCSINPNNTPAGRIEQLLSLSPGNAYYEAGYSQVWLAIGTHAPFDNTCRCTEQIDNGEGISWTFSVAAGASVTRSNLTVFSPTGIIGPPPPPPPPVEAIPAPSLGMAMLSLLGTLMLGFGLVAVRRRPFL